MSPAVKFLRIALPIAFLAFVIIIVISFTGRPRRVQQRQGEAVNIAPRTSTDKAKLVADAFEDTQTIGGRVTLKISAKKFIGFVSGWNRLEDVHLTVYRANGQSYDISSAVAQVNATTKEAEASGGVKVASSDGVEIQTAAIKFDGKKITNKIPVNFKIDDWSGRAGGLDLDVTKEMLSLNDSIDAEAASKSPAEPAMHLKAARATFQRTTGDVTFYQDVVLTRKNDTIRADQVQAKLAPGMKQITGFEGSGGVVVSLADNSPLAQSNAPGSNMGATRITADRFFTESFNPGRIDTVIIRGEQGDAVAVMSGPPRKTLTAKQFRVVLDGEKLKEVQSEKNVVFIEEDTPRRRVTASIANVYFDPATRRPINLYMQDQITFNDGKIDAAGDRANYEFATKKLVLSALPGKAPSIRTESETIRANVIEVLAAEQLLKATGNVFAEMRQKAGAASASGSSVFPERQPVNVNADVALLNRASKTAQFNGNVRAWQGTNTIFAKQLSAAADGETLTASGEVRASLSNAVKGATGTSPVLTRSDTLTAKRRDKRIDLDGNVRIEDNGRVLQSEKATAFLDARQKIDRIEASGKLTITERATSRKGSGDHALYKLAQKTILVDGNPATMADPKGTIRGSQIVFDIGRNKVEVISGAAPTEATYNPQ
jgi:lipopolysaccharide transport protein LptA